jgi:hypothetical protein
VKGSSVRYILKQSRQYMGSSIGFVGINVCLARPLPNQQAKVSFILALFSNFVDLGFNFVSLQISLLIMRKERANFL